MSIATIRRRPRDGIHQITQDSRPLPPGERYLLMTTAFLAAAGLFVSGLAPGLLVLGVVGACAITESLLQLDELLKLRRPLADVHDFPQAFLRRR